MPACRLTGFPCGIFLDTNALIDAGQELSATWLTHIRETSLSFNIPIVISEVVLSEYCEWLHGQLVKKKSHVHTSFRVFKKIGINTPSIDEEELSIPTGVDLKELLRDKLVNSGFIILPDCELTVQELLEEAVKHKLPFQENDKGFRDAVILETFARHIEINECVKRVLIVSRDRAVCRSQSRFVDRRLEVEFHPPGEVCARLTELIEQFLDDLARERNERLEEHVMTHEEAILAYCRATPISTSEWWLKPPTCTDLPFLSTIEKISKIEPVRIDSMALGTKPPLSDIPEDRYPVSVTVEYSVEMEVSHYPNRLLGQSIVLDPANTLMGTPLEFPKQQFFIEKKYQVLEVARTRTLLCSIDRSTLEQSGDYSFQIDGF
ncbi:MAG: DUF4935 domain-containing protein [bacterium]|nr:DUF4935 domain-containing protein [bacterium]